MSVSALKTTKVWCCDCECKHDAKIYEKENSIFGKVECPKKEKTVTLANDAALWKAVYEKSNFDSDLVTGIHGGSLLPDSLPQNEKQSRYSNRGIRLYRLDITNACNFHCPICYANAEKAEGSAKKTDGGVNKFFLEVETAKKIAGFLRKEGAKEIALTGGEPTLHPELESIIAVFKKAGIRTAILTNGIRIAREAGFAQRLKKYGLRRAYVQFDTMDPSVHKKMRGNNFTEEKKQALINCKKAKIKTSVIAVIIKDNLNETGALLDHMKILVPRFGEIVFVTAIRDAGRFDMPQDSFVYKEDIIKSLVKTSSVNGISEDNFYPFPVYRPFGMNIHPCANVILPVVFFKDRIELLENYVNIKKMYKLLNKKKSTFCASLKAFFIFMSALNYKKLPALLRILFCYLTKLGNTYINYVLIQNFLVKDFQDFECLNNCNAYHIGSKGEICSVCIYNQDFKSGHPWTRYSK